MADFQSSLTAAQIETVLTDAIVPTRGKPLTEAEKIQAREYIGASALGEGIKILAHFDTLDELKAAVPTPKAGAAYSVGIELPHRMYAYDFYHNEWHDYGPIRSDDITARLAQNLAVSSSAWVEDTTVFEDYTFKASIPLGEITGNDFSIVAFSPSDASSGIFCPIAFAFDGYVEIWANKKPDAEIIIPAVTFIALGDTSETGNSTKGITNASGKSSQSVSFENIIVSDQTWEQAGNEADYPYRAAILLPDIDESWAVDVQFENPSENLAGFTLSYAGGFYIFAKSPPESLVKIKTVICSQTEVKEFANEVFATITVTYAEGKTVTCTDGTTTLTAKTTSGSWQFGVPHAGEWVVSDGTNSQTVNITTHGQSESVELKDPVLWLFKNGDQCVGVTGGWQVNVGQITSTQMIIGTDGTHTKNAIQTKNTNIDLSEYKTLAAHVVSNTIAGAGWFIFGVGKASAIGGYGGANQTYAEKAVYNQQTGWFYLDISAVSNAMSLLVAYASGEVVVDKIYASKEVLT